MKLFKRRSVFLEFVPILVAAALCVLVVVFVLLPNETTLVVNLHGQNPCPNGGLLGDAGFVRAETTTEAIASMRSDETLGRVVEDQQLTLGAVPHSFPVLGAMIAAAAQPDPDTSIPFGIPALGRYAWGGERIQVDTFEVPPASLGEKWILVAGAVGTYHLFAPHTATEQSVLDGRVGVLARNALAGGTVTLLLSALTARPGTEFFLTRASREKVIEHLQNRLWIVEQPSSSGRITLTLRDEEKRGLAVLHGVAQEYDRQVRERSTALLATLTKQVAAFKERLENSTNALNHFLLEHGLVDAHDLQKQRSALTDQIRLLDQKHEEAVRRLGSTHPAVAALEKQRAHLVQAQEAIPDLWRELTLRSQAVAMDMQRYLEKRNRMDSICLGAASSGD